VRLAAGGGSSTMPQKTNPVLPSILATIARRAPHLSAALAAALPHREQRDAAAWIAEWLALPELVLLTARALAAAEELARSVEPDAQAMTQSITATNGTAFAEALSFALAETMPRHEAQAAIKSLVKQGKNLESLVREAYPHARLDHVFDPRAQLGTAPDEARAFARKARE